MMRLKVLLCPFELLARKMDSSYRILVEDQATCRFAPIAVAEYLGIFALGALCRWLGFVWVWVAVLPSWLFAGLLDPPLWRRIYGREVSRKASLIANLDVVYIFLLGWIA
jgi:hypothetical protein